MAAQAAIHANLHKRHADASDAINCADNFGKEIA
jgi:hypothetical protein